MDDVLELAGSKKQIDAIHTGPQRIFLNIKSIVIGVSQNIVFPQGTSATRTLYVRRGTALYEVSKVLPPNPRLYSQQMDRARTW